MELNKSKLTSPLIVIDPVQKDRNAAAALDHEKFEILKHRTKEFLKKPSTEFFEIKILTEQDIMEKFRKNKLVILKSNPLRKKEDVAGAKMLKAFHFIEKELIFHGFKILESDMLWHGKSHSLFYYSLKNDKLSKTIELQGPPLKTFKHVSLFKKKHKKTFIKGKRLFALEKRKFNDVRDLVKNLFKTPNVKDNVSNIKLI